MKLYSLKQLVGGFLLLLLFIVLFVINLTFKSGLVNIKMFLNPILVILAICLLIYVIKLNELIKLNKSKLKKKDTFNLDTCPNEYEPRTQIVNVDNKKYVDKLCYSDTYGPVYLNGNPNICGTDTINDTNGCFNKYTLRDVKCKKIKDYYEKLDRNVLKNWVEYNNNCV